MKISFVICTRNRPNQLMSSMESILRRTRAHRDYEIIIVDQSSNLDIKTALRYLQARYPSAHIRLVSCDGRGLGRARNYGVRAATGKLLCFLDDDCLATEEYVKTVRLTNLSQLDSGRIGIVFGRTLAYRPGSHPGELISATFSKRTAKPVNRFVPHWKYLGHGNNMLVPAKIFRTIGLFRPWLGAGSIGESGEDSEFAIRCLTCGYQIAYNHHQLLYHDAWLSRLAMRQKSRRYLCGAVATYTLYGLRGNRASWSVLGECLGWVKGYWQSDLRELEREPKMWPRTVGAMISQIYYILKGFLLAGAHMLQSPQYEG